MQEEDTLLSPRHFQSSPAEDEPTISRATCDVPPPVTEIYMDRWTFFDLSLVQASHKPEFRTLLIHSRMLSFTEKVMQCGCGTFNSCTTQRTFFDVQYLSQQICICTENIISRSLCTPYHNQPTEPSPPLPLPPSPSSFLSPPSSLLLPLPFPSVFLAPPSSLPLPLPPIYTEQAV